MVRLGVLGVLGVVTAVAGACASDAHTRRIHGQKWCLSSMVESVECSYATYEACEAARSGVGGTCTINLRYIEATPIGRQRQGR